MGNNKTDLTKMIKGSVSLPSSSNTKSDMSSNINKVGQLSPCKAIVGRISG